MVHRETATDRQTVRGRDSQWYTERSRAIDSDAQIKGYGDRRTEAPIDKTTGSGTVVHTDTAIWRQTSRVHMYTRVYQALYLSADIFSGARK